MRHHEEGVRLLGGDEDKLAILTRENLGNGLLVFVELELLDQTRLRSVRDVIDSEGTGDSTDEHHRALLGDIDGDWLHRHRDTRQLLVSRDLPEGNSVITAD